MCLRLSCDTFALARRCVETKSSSSSLGHRVSKAKALGREGGAADLRKQSTETINHATLCRRVFFTNISSPTAFQERQEEGKPRILSMEVDQTLPSSGENGAPCMPELPSSCSLPPRRGKVSAYALVRRLSRSLCKDSGGRIPRSSLTLRNHHTLCGFSSHKECSKR